MNNNGFLKIFFIIILVIAAAAYGVTFGQKYYNQQRAKRVAISDFDNCLAAGMTIMESYPRKCQTEDGQVFVEDIGNELSKLDLIKIDSPRPNQVISSPLIITGQARGYWFFEGSFPVAMLYKGQVVAEGVATAQSDWMTEDFVDFKAEINYKEPTSGKGTLLLKKDNPSGLSENADELSIPIFFE